MRFYENLSFVYEVRLEITVSPCIPRVSDSRRNGEIFFVTVVNEFC